MYLIHKGLLKSRPFSFCGLNCVLSNCVQNLAELLCNSLVV